MIPLKLPEYLAQFLAHKLRNTYERTPSGNFINVDRYTFFGSLLHRLLEKSELPPEKGADHYLRFSNLAGNNYKGVPEGRCHFMKLPAPIMAHIERMLKDDFDEGVIFFIQGAEFSHRHKGWSLKTRHGIRRAATLEFCENHGVATNKRVIERILKMYQRYQKGQSAMLDNLPRKITQTLSL